MPFNDVNDYYRHIKTLVSVRSVTNHQYAINYAIGNVKSHGTILTRVDHPLRFLDGATFKFIERIRIVNREVERVAYSYSYTRSDYYFRYDKDPERISHPEHALCHLHANREEPRFITHDTSFEEVFSFILACFPIAP